MTNSGYGGLKLMLTDTESGAPGACSDSSGGRSRASNLARSERRSKGNSAPAQAEDAGREAGPKVSSLDFLLSLLQSDLGEIQDLGGSVRFFDNLQGLIIQLPGARLCKTHRMIHSGEKCPHC